jgi:hypothetical protein
LVESFRPVLKIKGLENPEDEELKQFSIDKVIENEIEI